MSKYVGSEDYNTIIQHIAFTNYVQFILPVEEGKSFRETKKSDMSERDFAAFNETLLELKPDIVIIWGCVINSRVKEQNEYLISLEELKESENYIGHLAIPGIDHPITLINPFHPSSTAWKKDLDRFDKYFTNILS